MTTLAKGDFIEIEFTGKVNGEVFDSNVPEDLKKIDPKAEPRKTGLIIGQGMVVKGLDKELEGKQLNIQYVVKVPFKEGFGPRMPSLVKAIPLKVFSSQNVVPRPGMSFLMDRNLVTIRAVSGARVITDFNNPLAGKDLEYSFKIIKIVDSFEDKSRIFFECFLRGVPEFKVEENVIVSGPKQLEAFVMIFKDKFKQLVGKDLEFKVVDKKASEVDNNTNVSTQ